MMEALMLVSGMLLTYFIGRAVGMKQGKADGIKQAETILLNAIQVRSSPTAHQALICLAGNQTREQMIKELQSSNARAEGRRG
jgi:hypothetical protein